MLIKQSLKAPPMDFEYESAHMKSLFIFRKSENKENLDTTYIVWGGILWWNLNLLLDLALKLSISDDGRRNNHLLEA